MIYDIYKNVHTASLSKQVYVNKRIHVLKMSKITFFSTDTPLHFGWPPRLRINDLR